MAQQSEKNGMNKWMVLGDLYIKKIWDISKISVLAVAIYLPFIYIMLYVTQWFVPELISPDAPGYSPEDISLMEFIVRFAYGSVLMTVPIVVFGPAAAGFTRIYRSLVTGQPFFLWSDFWATLKKFFAKGMIISVIDIVLFMLFGLAFNFYINYSHIFMPDLPGLLRTFMIGIVFIVIVLFMMMHLYMYQLLIQYDLPIFKIYRYSLTFAILRLIPNTLILAFCAAVVIIPFEIHFLFGSTFFIFLAHGICGVMINYFTWPAIQKHFEPMVKR